MLRGVAAGGPLVANYGEYNFNVAAKEKEGTDFGGALDQFFKKMDEAAPAVASDPPPAPTPAGPSLFFILVTCFMHVDCFRLLRCGIW